MPGGMLVPAITRGVIQRRRWLAIVKGPVVTDIGPDVACDGFTLDQDQHRDVIAVQPLGSHDMALDQPMQRLQESSCRRQPGRPASKRSDRCLPACIARSIGSAADAGRTSRTGSRARRCGPAKPRGMTWNGAGGGVIVSHSQHENRSRTVWITFH
jgi:hypothetical protein